MEMKSLTDVLEKLRVDDIILPEKFPIDGTLADMAKFLKKEGFEEIDDNATVFDSAKSKCYTTYKNMHLWFTDTSTEKNSKENPIFYIVFNIPIYSAFYTDSNGKVFNIIENDKKKFLEELNKRFGWK